MRGPAANVTKKFFPPTLPKGQKEWYARTATENLCINKKPVLFVFFYIIQVICPTVIDTTIIRISPSSYGFRQIFPGAR